MVNWSYLRLYLLFSDLLCFYKSVNKRPIGFVTCPLNPETPFLTHTCSNQPSPPCSSYLHISILLILHPLSLLTHTHAHTHTHTHAHTHTRTHTHTYSTSITELPHTLHINSAAVLSASPVLLPSMLTVFLKPARKLVLESCKRTHTHTLMHAHTHTHTENPTHPEETKWGQTCDQPDTHSHTFF